MFRLEDVLDMLVKYPDSLEHDGVVVTEERTN
jgi:hypothetical protein